MPLIYLQQTDGARIPLAVDGNGHLVLSPTGSITIAGGADTRIYTYNGSTWERTRMDSTTHTLQTIDYVHHEIHSGSHYLYTDAVPLNSGGVQNYLITTPDTTRWAHMLFVLDGSAVTQFELYEGADRVGSVLQTLGNSNRNSANTATITVHKGYAGGTTDGNLIYIYKGGSTTGGSRSAASSRNDDEIILKQNTKYILRVTSSTNGNLTNVRLSWYEHVNK